MRENQSIIRQKPALLMIGASFVLCSFFIIVNAGIWNTPYETTDSLGRRMGFNDPLSWEHFWIILSNFRPQVLLTPAYAYTWLLLAMHGLGAWLIARTDRLSRPRIRWFFALQLLLFPFGWLGFIALPMMVGWLFNGTFDRETIIDVPFISITAHTVWIGTAAVLVLASWRANIRTTTSSERFEPRIA